MVEFSGFTSSNLSQSRPMTDQIFLDKAAVKFAVQGRWQILWVKYAQNKHENFTAKFCRKFRCCTTNLVHPLGLAENQDFAASVQTSPCPGWAFPAPCHSAPTPLTDPLASRYLTSADLYLGAWFKILSICLKLIVSSIWDRLAHVVF